MVIHGEIHFLSIKFVQKIVRHCFGILNEYCSLHRRCCIVRVSIIRTTITFYSFRITGAITSQNEALSEMRTSDGNRTSSGSLISKNCNQNLFRGLGSLLYSISSLHNVFGKTGSQLTASVIQNGGMMCTMVKSIFIFIEFILKVVRHCLGILNES